VPFAESFEKEGQAHIPDPRSFFLEVSHVLTIDEELPGPYPLTCKNRMWKKLEM
jgi:hypothetical protein